MGNFIVIMIMSKCNNGKLIVEFVLKSFIHYTKEIIRDYCNGVFFETRLVS